MFYYDDNRYQYIMEYPDVIPSLELVFKGFKKERKDAKRALAISMFLAMRREGIYVIPYEALVAVGINPRTFYKMNNKYPLFECVNDQYSFMDKKAREWMPTKEYYLVMKHMLDRESIKSRFLMAKFDEKVLHVENSKYLNLSEKKYDFKHPLVLDTDRIRARMEEVEGDEWNQYSMIYTYCIMQENPHQYYQRVECGRLFGMNKVNIQNIKGKIRDDIFYGYYRIDAVNAHYTLLSSETNDEAIHEYVNDPDFYREMVADEIGRTPKEVKKCLIMILYGASKKVISKDIGEEAADDFLSHPFVKRIKKGMRDAAKNMIKKYGHVEGKHLQNEILAHHLMKLESKMLDIAIAIVGEDVQGLYFDGLISKKEVDIHLLEGMIYREMGIRVRWTQEVIGEE